MKGNELDLYTTEEPSHNLAFTLFDGTWVSNIPGFGFGSGSYFDDGRIKWLLDQSGGIAGKAVLELGPLEGAHTYMLSKAGAANILSVESNSKAFLKCLIVQNALKFKAEFLYGDFRPMLAKRDKRFDLVLASGVLYHMTDPVSLLEDMSHVTDSMFIWTHYYDPEIAATSDKMGERLNPDPTVSEFRGKKIYTHRHSYLEDVESEKFIGGSAHYSEWMTRDSLINVLESLGMIVTIGLDSAEKGAAPSILLHATRIPGFDESDYLDHHRDVAEAVENGQFKSGAEHYIRFGRSEGRSI